MEDYEVIAELEGVTVQEAKLSYAAREKLPREAFCGPNRSFPAHDAEHVKKGLQLLKKSKASEKVKERIYACLKVKAKKYGIQINEVLSEDVAPLLAWYKTEHPEMFK